MVQKAPVKTRALQPAPAQRAARAPTPCELLRALQRLGLQPHLRNSACGYEAPHIGIRQSALAPATSRVVLQRELARIRALLLARNSVTVSLLDADHATPRELEWLLRQLRRAADAPCIDKRRLGLALPARQLPLPAYLVMSRVMLGEGPRYLMLGEQAMQRSDGAGAQQATASCSVLYQQRMRTRALRPAYGACLRSRCALLPDERGLAINAQFAMAVPADSAWLPVAVNVCRFCDRRGQLREQEFFRALRQGLRLADALFDQLYWVDAQQRRDALANRRIAFLLQGVGDMLVLQRAQPSSMACIRALDRLVAEIHDCLWTESHRLAAERGVLPALTTRDPSLQINDKNAQCDWRRRWQEALSRAAVRHRNLLVMSPYALLPTAGACSMAHADLLPLLGYADVVSFAGNPCFARWCYEDYRAFHRRAIAVMRRRNAASCVATGV